MFLYNLWNLRAQGWGVNWEFLILLLINHALSAWYINTNTSRYKKYNVLGTYIYFSLSFIYKIPILKELYWFYLTDYFQNILKYKIICAVVNIGATIVFFFFREGLMFFSGIINVPIMWRLDTYLGELDKYLGGTKLPLKTPT